MDEEWWRIVKNCHELAVDLVMNRAVFQAASACLYGENVCYHR